MSTTQPSLPFVEILLVFLALGCLPKAASLKPSETREISKRRVLVLSIDGLRGDYLSYLHLRTIQSLIQNGTVANYVQNPINVASITNHYSVVTGLYPESHGIISKTMFDPKLKRAFYSKTRNQAVWWKNVHPLWQEVERQGKGKSAVCRWPGVYGPMEPALQCKAGKNHSLKDDIDQVIKWFARDQVHLVLLHVDNIRKAGMKWGPYSHQAIRSLKVLDSLLKYFLDKIQHLNVNIVMTAESGVTDLNWDHVVNLDPCIDHKSYVLTQSQGTLLLYAKREYHVNEIVRNLTACPHVKVYSKNNLPEHFHFSHNRRIPPIIAFVPLGFVVRSSKQIHRKIDEILHGKAGAQRDMGGTGYHPGYKEMRGIFIGYGPSFRPGLKFRSIENVDIYGVVCHLLGVKPRFNNGSHDVVTSMFEELKPLKVNRSATDGPTPYAKMVNKGIFSDPDVRILFWFLVATTAALFLFCCVGCITTMRDNKRHGYKKRAKVTAPGTKRLLSNDSSSGEE